MRQGVGRVTSAGPLTVTVEPDTDIVITLGTDTVTLPADAGAELATAMRAAELTYVGDLTVGVAPGRWVIGKTDGSGKALKVPFEDGPVWFEALDTALTALAQATAEQEA